ncbi:MAG: tetratricopeptide repeat protein [Bacteroidota bacterium]|nr:tetratricopeptide repeat protein [Bacteroidota bacterium]
MSQRLSDQIKSSGSNTAVFIHQIKNNHAIANEDLLALVEICSKSNNPLELYTHRGIENKTIDELIKDGKIRVVEQSSFQDDIKNVIPLCLPLTNSPTQITKWAIKANKSYNDQWVIVADGKLPEKASFIQKFLHYFSNFWPKLFTGVDSHLSDCEVTLIPFDVFDQLVIKNKIDSAWQIAALASKNNQIKKVSFDLGLNDFNWGDGFKSLIKGKLLGFWLLIYSFFKITNTNQLKMTWRDINFHVYKKTFAVLSILLLSTMIWIAKDYNVTWDEPAHNEFSKYVIKYYTSFGSDTSMFESKNSNFGILTYGSSVDLIIRAVNDIFSIKNEYITRHIIDAMIGFLMILFTALLVRKLSGWLPAVITIIALIASPSLFGHFFNNSKDIPFATGYIMTIYYLTCLLLEFPNAKHQTKVMLAVSIGFALSVRVGAILLFAYLALFIGLYWLIIQSKKKTSFKDSILPKLKLFLIISISAYFIGILFWPYALRQPLTGVITALKQFEKFGLLTYYELFEGVRLYEKPWYYIPKMVLITAPVGLLIGFFISFLTTWIKKDKLHLLVIALLIFVTIFPLAYAIYKKSYVYNGWRHFLFIYPSVTVLGILGWQGLINLFKNQSIRIYLWILPLLLFVKPILWSVQNHPYQYMYFNEIIGGIQGAHGNYDIDYWNQTPRAAFEWLVKNKPEILELDENGKSKLKINANSNQEALKTFVQEGKDVTCLWTREMEWTNNNWDYAIWSTRTLSKNQILDGYWPPKGTIKTIDVDGVPITAIVKAEHQHSYWGNYYLKKNNFDSALYFYLKAYAYNPLEEEFARGVANSYKGKMKLDSSIIFYQKAISLKIGNYDALQSIGEIYYTQSMMKDPNNPDVNLLNKAYENLALAFKNKKNSSAPLLMGEINLLKNQNNEARDYFNKFLETYGNVGRGYLGLGKAQLRINELDSAFMNFQYAIQLEPNNAEAYYYLGTELQKIGRKQEAEQFLNKYMQLIGN